MLLPTNVCSLLPPSVAVTYAMEYGCDIGLGASAVNAGNFISFALLLAVANAVGRLFRTSTRPTLNLLPFLHAYV